MNNLIAMDLDDTINGLTKKMCEEFGIEQLTLDQILKGQVPDEGFSDHRKAFLDNQENWSLPPHGVGKKLLEKVNKSSFKGVVLTKTPTLLEGSEMVAALKVKAHKEYFPNVDTFLCTGDKSVFTARGIVDDLIGNCLRHNKAHNSTYLLFQHGFTTERDIDLFLKVCRYQYNSSYPEAALVVVDTPLGIVGFKRSDKAGLGLPCGTIEDGETPEIAALRELREETGLTIEDEALLESYGTMIAPNGCLVHCFKVQLETPPVLKISEDFEKEGSPVFMNPEGTFGDVKDYFFDFNNLLLRNMRVL